MPSATCSNRCARSSSPPPSPVPAVSPARSCRRLPPPAHAAVTSPRGGKRLQLRLIPVEEVQYFLADQKSTTVRHLGGEDLIEDSLRLLESEFGAVFVRIHRNALIGVKYLERIERSAEGQYFVRLRGCEAPLQVSRRMAGELRERFRI